MICFHHNDADGKCAMGIVKLAHSDQNAVYVQVNYDDPPDITAIEFGEKVIIVDFSLEPSVMRCLLLRTLNVIWIDHHKTAIAKYENFEHDIAGVRDSNKSGCELTWGFFFPEKPTPRAVQLIGDRDIWQWQYGDETAWMHYGLRGEESGSESTIWTDILQPDYNLPALLTRGKSFQAYQQACDADLIATAGFLGRFAGYNCIFLNAPRVSSETFAEHGCDIAISFYYAAAKCKWIVSLYSTSVDVSEIAVKYGGGGHKGAAGFVCDYPPFLTAPTAPRADIVNPSSQIGGIEE